MTAQTAKVDAAHDVVEFLIGQHMQIRDSFTEVEKSTGKARRAAFERLVTLLAVHETAEEQLIHPMGRTEVHGGGDIVDDRLSEEREAKEMLAKLEDVGPDAAEFPSLLAKLRASVLMYAHTMRRPTSSATCAARSQRRSWNLWWAWFGQPRRSPRHIRIPASSPPPQHRRRSRGVAVRPDEGHGPPGDVRQSLNDVWLRSDDRSQTGRYIPRDVGGKTMTYCVSNKHVPVSS